MFKNRKEAGIKLSNKLLDYKDQDFIVLAIPRGGVIVGKEISDKLNLKLDLILSRKLRDKIDSNVIIGAVSPDRSFILDNEKIKKFDIKEDYIKIILRIESLEIERRNMKYKGNRNFLNVENKNIILVDDGISTGNTMEVTLKFLKKMKPKKIIVAIPLLPKNLIEKIKTFCDNLIYIETSENTEIKDNYKNFNKIMDDDVIKILNKNK